MKQQKIIKLTAENVKRLRAVEITPDGHLVVIGGKNGAGKSSVLDSIMYALGGKSVQPERPLRKGEKTGKIVCELDDLIITRTLTAGGGGSVKVEPKDKELAKYASPQAVLDKLVGSLTFDPLSFLRMDNAEQLETVRAVVGIDFSKLEERRRQLYEERTEVGREDKRLKGQTDSMPHHPDAPAEEVSINDLVKELQGVERQNEIARIRGQELDRASDHICRVEKEIQRMKVDLGRTKETLDDLQEEHTTLLDDMKTHQELDTTDLRDRISAAEGINQQVRENNHRARTLTDLEAANTSYESLTSNIEELDQEKTARIAEANFPVDGLSFGDGALEYNDLPFDQASQAEQLQVSVAMGLAMNPNLKVLLVRDGSLLDQGSLQLMAEMAKSSGAQIWLERVGDGEECQVIIEDGSVFNGDH